MFYSDFLRVSGSTYSVQAVAPSKKVLAELAPSHYGPSSSSAQSDNNPSCYDDQIAVPTISKDDVDDSIDCST